jgi:hypothetical protein
LVVEYTRMLDVSDYAVGVFQKLSTYPSNEIPALFIYPEDLGERYWSEHTVEGLRQTTFPLYGPP